MKQLNLSAIIVIAAVLCALVAVSGCTTESPAASPTAAPTAAPTATPMPVALSITGSVDVPLNLTMADLAAYPNMSITTMGKNNTTVNATGVSLNKILDDAKVNASALNATFIGADGYNKTVNLTTIRAANDSIISYEADGTLKDIIPGQSTGAWVGKLTTITVS